MSDETNALDFMGDEMRRAASIYRKYGPIDNDAMDAAADQLAKWVGQGHDGSHPFACDPCRHVDRACRVLAEVRR